MYTIYWYRKRVGGNARIDAEEWFQYIQEQSKNNSSVFFEMVSSMLDHLDLLKPSLSTYQNLAQSNVNINLVLADKDPVVTHSAGMRLASLLNSVPGSQVNCYTLKGTHGLLNDAPGDIVEIINQSYSR